MASYVLVTVIHWFINRAVLKKHIYQDMRMFLILFAFSVVCLAMPLLYDRIFRFGLRFCWLPARRILLATEG